MHPKIVVRVKYRGHNQSDTDTNLKRLPCLGEFGKIALQAPQGQDPILLIFERLLQLSSFVAADLLLSFVSYCITGNSMFYFKIFEIQMI